MKDKDGNSSPADYRLDDQIGFILRRATQRHLSIFAEGIPEITPQQFAALAKLHEHGEMSQNLLGRHTAMDAATIKGVIDRLRKRGLIESRQDSVDSRRLLVRLTKEGKKTYAASVSAALDISAATLAPLTKAEQTRLLDLLAKIT